MALVYISLASPLAEALWHRPANFTVHGRHRVSRPCSTWWTKKATTTVCMHEVKGLAFGLWWSPCAGYESDRRTRAISLHSAGLQLSVGMRFVVFVPQLGTSARQRPRQRGNVPPSPACPLRSEAVPGFFHSPMWRDDRLQNIDVVKRKWSMYFEGLWDKQLGCDNVVLINGVCARRGLL